VRGGSWRLRGGAAGGAHRRPWPAGALCWRLSLSYCSSGPALPPSHTPQVIQGWLLELLARHPELRLPGARADAAYGGPEWLPDARAADPGCASVSGTRRLRLDVSITGHSLVGFGRAGGCRADAACSCLLPERACPALRGLGPCRPL
jgi:hypothetical protein